MFYVDEDGVNVIEFGTGDVLVACGILDDPTISVGSVSLIPQEARELGAEHCLIDENGGECPLDTDVGVHTRLLFTATESIDVLIEHLIGAKKAMQEEAK